VLRRLSAIVLVCVLVASACSSGDEVTIDRGLEGTTTSTGTGDSTPASSVTSAVLDPASPESWTVLVYVMGDTDLEPFALEDLTEMATVGSGSGLNIVALVDRHPSFADDGVLNLGDWEDTKLISVQRDELAVLAEGTELNLGSADTLATFVEQGITSYPADHYALVLWDHGAGWPGMGPDETDGLDVLDLAEIDDGLTRGLGAAGVDKVDLIGFDACLMATYEVASVSAKHADYMVASEELEPGHGWDYRGLAVLLDNPGATPVDLGQSIIDSFAAQAEVSGTGSDITLSLIDLSKMTGLQSALAELAGPVTADIAAAAPTLGVAQDRALGFGRNADPDLAANMIDLGSLMIEVGNRDSGLAPEARAVGAALDELVVSQVAGPASAKATGLSIYFPPVQRNFRQGYLFVQSVPTWPDVLAAFYQAGDAIPVEEQPTFVETDLDNDGEFEVAEFFFDEDGLNMYATFDAAAAGNVVDAAIFYGILDEETQSIIFIGEEPADVADDGSGFVGAIYDLTVLTITDGIDTVPAYLVFTVDEEAGFAFIDIPLVYEDPTTSAQLDVSLSLVVDAATGDILEESYFVVDESGTWGEATLAPEGLIFPVLLEFDSDGNENWVVASDVGLWANIPDLQYEFEPLESGTVLYAELGVFDFGGNSAFADIVAEVP
jgi:hypothetical protein